MCGPDPDAGALAASGSGLGATYDNFVDVGANNDCGDPNAPAGVVGITIVGHQAGTTDLATFCVPRPDLLATAPQSLGSGVAVIDLSGSAGSCSFALDLAQPITGTVTAHGLCTDGSAGFSLTFDGNVGVTRTCGSATDAVTLALTGDALVTQ